MTFSVKVELTHLGKIEVRWKLSLQSILDHTVRLHNNTHLTKHNNSIIQKEVSPYANKTLF
jgi:hypothetical protein